MSLPKVSVSSLCMWSLHLTVPPAYNAGRVTNQAALCREHIICHSHEQPPPIGDYGRLLLLGIGGRVCSRSRQQNSVFHQQCHRSAARRGCPAESWVSPPCHTSLCTMLWLPLTWSAIACHVWLQSAKLTSCVSPLVQQLQWKAASMQQQLFLTFLQSSKCAVAVILVGRSRWQWQ